MASHGDDSASDGDTPLESERRRHERLRAHFDELADLAPALRATRLEMVEQSLRTELEALLTAHDRGSGGLSVDPLGPARSALLDALAGEPLPRLVGRTLAHYDILECIGVGGMGLVYRARDTRLERDVALKVLPSHLLAEETLRERFLREARTAASIDHPNVCAIHDTGLTDDGEPYIAMALVDGETIEGILRRGAMRLDDALDIARQVAAGLAAAHERDVIHGDIKPANIMRSRDGHVRILDFGVARTVAATGVSSAGLIAGTAAYLAPEQLRGARGDARADLWALGTVLFEMITGERAFRRETPAATMHAILHDDPIPLLTARSNVPASITRLVAELLAKQPEERIASARAVQQSLEAPGAHLLDVAPRSAGVGTRLVGRDDESEELGALLERSRLITITGPAGAGKSALARELAHSVAARFTHGIAVVQLDAVEHAGDVAGAIARTLRIAETAGRDADVSLHAELAGREMLLVLDTFERVVDAAPLVGSLLEGAPRLRIVVTSRAPLHLELEQEYPVGPLALPQPGERRPEALLASAAVQLFVERARRARPRFELDAGNAHAVADLCIALDGLPLAIELAAARIRLLSPQAILSRLSSRLDLLRAPGRAAGRHQTLRDAIAWSHDLLDEAQRRCLRRAAVFAGGFDLEAAVAVLGDEETSDGGAILDRLGELVEQSLLVQEAGADGEPRFRMLDTLRSFAAERLAIDDDAPMTRARHSGHYRELAHAIGGRVFGSGGAEALERLDGEAGNLLAALEWAIARGDAATALSLAADLSGSWMMRGRLREGRRLLERAIAIESRDTSPELAARGRNGLGSFCFMLGDNHDAARWLEEALVTWRALERPRSIAATMNDLTWVALELNRFDRADELIAETLAVAAGIDDHHGRAVALYNLGWLESYRGSYWRAYAALEESVRLHRESGDQRGAALALVCLARVERMHDRPDHALARLEQALALHRDSNDRLFLAWIGSERALVLLESGEVDEAARALGPAITLWRDAGQGTGLAWALTIAAEIDITTGRFDQAAVGLDEARPLAEATGSRWCSHRVALCSSALVAIAEGTAAARARLLDALDLAYELGLELPIAETIELLILALIDDLPADVAARLLASAGAARARLGAPLPPRHRARHERVVAILGERLGTTLADAWGAGELIPLDAAATIARSV